MPATARRRRDSAPSQGIFHKKGLAYFWVFNDKCDPDALQGQLDAFAAAGGVSALCLHPRPGLLLPYGGSEWFDFIAEMCRRIANAGLDIWLYDEDPYPSGAASGRVFYERPEFNARHIEMVAYDPRVMENDLFAFPVGELLFCGLVPDDAGASAPHGRAGLREVVDLTDRVGVVRRKWQTWEQWDSRFFYPDTPIYKFQRADTGHPEYAITVPEVPPGMKLVAFVARATTYDWIPWGGLPDTLNREATAHYLRLTHEKYHAAVGHMFGREIKAIFTDEPKYMASKAWTPGMAEDWLARYGYDLRPRLYQLFSDAMDDQSCLTRLHYREYLGQRFEHHWLQPVSEWCHAHHLNLVGHISPEDDPIEQANYISNLFPLFRHFDLAGIDLIIPAVGDRNHPLINIGCTSASSFAQQRGKAGVMSETGACAAGPTGKDISGAKIGRILKWQTVMGVTSPLMHCAYSSVRGPRAYEYPPNYGPNNEELWPQMVPLHRELAELQAVIHDARQVAPVAILWTIRAFQMQNIDWQTDPTGMRRAISNLLLACLDRQVGTHILDEEVLWDAKLEGGELRIGRARYTHLLVPGCTVLHRRSVRALRAVQEAGLGVAFSGELPARQQDERGLAPLDLSWARQTDVAAAVAELPRLIEIAGDVRDLRCTAWEPPGRKKATRLLMNLRPDPATLRVEGRTLKLQSGEVRTV